MFGSQAVPSVKSVFISERPLLEISLYRESMVLSPGLYYG